MGRDERDAREDDAARLAAERAFQRGELLRIDGRKKATRSARAGACPPAPTRWARSSDTLPPGSFNVQGTIKR